MSAPIQPTQPTQSDEDLSDLKSSMPPWARKRPLPAEAQPQSEQPSDVANEALRRRFALEPDVVPHPPIEMMRAKPLRWIASLGLVCLAAGNPAFYITALPVTDPHSPTSNTGDRGNAVSGFPTAPSNDNFNVAAANIGGRGNAVLGFPTAPSNDNFNVVATRLVVEGGQATANAPLTLGGSSGGETVYLSMPLVVKLEWAPKTEQATLEPRPVVAPPPRPPQVQLDQDEIDWLMKRGHQMLQSGDIPPARLLLRRAALAGSGRAALELGGTYDPEVLREIGTQGFAPDPALAREWYQKASELGSSEATRRLEGLVQSQP